MQAPNSKTSNSGDLSWDARKFSTSVNGILRRVNRTEEGIDVFSVINMLHDVHPEYGSLDPNYFKCPDKEQGLNFVKLLVFIKANKSSVNLQVHTAAEYAKLYKI